MDMEKRRASQRAHYERNKDKFSKRSREYDKNNTKRKTIRFYPTDMALCDYLEQQEPGYLKRLIREDMERNGVEYEPKPKRNRWDGHEKKED